MITNTGAKVMFALTFVSQPPTIKVVQISAKTNLPTQADAVKMANAEAKRIGAEQGQEVKVEIVPPSDKCPICNGKH
jgi:hypothetical protein